MQLLPIQTPLLKQGDDLAKIIASSIDLHDGDIVAVSSKAVATVEGAVIDLKGVKVTQEAKQWSERSGRSPEFRQAVLDEVRRMNGAVLPSCPHVMLTELKPEGFSEGTLMVPNAGLDESNIDDGKAIGWPKDPVASVKKLRELLEEINTANQPNNQITKLGVLLTDSGCRPRRVGLVAIALTVSGFDPIQSHIGKTDLFGRKLKITTEAVADQLATAANFLMGNADQSTPAVVIRDHGIALTDFQGWVPGIEREEDIFRGVL